MERGVRNPSLQSIERLAKALNVSFSTLFQPLENAEIPMLKSVGAPGGKY
jgi:transcriptional regulator with XRE-family HTH domain